MKNLLLGLIVAGFAATAFAGGASSEDEEFLPYGAMKVKLINKDCIQIETTVLCRTNEVAPVIGNSMGQAILVKDLPADEGGVDGTGERPGHPDGWGDLLNSDDRQMQPIRIYSPDPDGTGSDHDVDGTGTRPQTQPI